MSKNIKRTGMTMTRQDGEKRHEKAGVSPRKPGRPGHRQVNCYAIGGGFLTYCVKQGWLIQEGKGRSTKYYVTKDGEEELKGFGIEV